MASFFSQASSYFGRSNIASNYTTTDTAATPTTHAGLWKIQRAVRSSSSAGAALAAAVVGRPATPNAGASGGGSSGVGGAGGSHASPGSSREDGAVAAAAAASGTATPTGNDRAVVSVWSHAITSRGRDRDLIIETLKKEASTLTRLRHPCILEVAEPLEELRSELIFATEPVMAPLSQALLASESSGRASDSVQLDEIEIQKGLLQIARALEFLHNAGLVHGNLTTEAVSVNVKGDWKLSGFAFLTPLKGPDGSLTPFQYPDYDPALPPALSRNFDYLAPEYALDEKLEPANDLYSLGCLMYATHNKGEPPFRNRNSLQNVRQNAERLSTVSGSSTWQRMNRDLISVLSSLLTRYPGSRPSAKAFQQSEYFNNLLTQTLKFMERESFAGKGKEERVSFLKGLLKILDQFSDRLLRRKVLPALLELMSDRTLLPFILPNVFVICKNLSSIEFTSNVLPRLKPLFNVQDPPQNQLILLEQVELFVSKTSPPVFREQVTPLLYSALEAENIAVQERALQTVPRLCEVLEYSHVKEVLFPKIATLFTKTRTLSVKCNTLICFHSMISVLDKHTLTEKLVPILARIKTREPSVMITTLAVHEAMSRKVDRETLATSIIPQLWTMSIGPQLNADQFQRFMRAIDEMGARVKTEQLQHLQEVKRMQDHTESYAAGASSASNRSSGLTASGEVDFATLVGSSKGEQVVRDMPVGGNALDVMAWDDLESTTASTPASGLTPALTPTHTGSSRGGFAASAGGSAPMSSSLSANAAMGPTRTASHGSSTLPSLAAPPPGRPGAGARPAFNASSSSLSTLVSSAPSPTPPPGWTSGSTLTPSQSMASHLPAKAGSASGPNYNISLDGVLGFGGAGAASTHSGSTPTPLALVPNSFTGLPPLTPQTSSLGGGGQSGGAYSSPSAALTPRASAQPLAPSHAPKPAAWGGSVLQPTSMSSASHKAGGGTNGASNTWSDFDPLN